MNGYQSFLSVASKGKLEMMHYTASLNCCKLVCMVVQQTERVSTTAALELLERTENLFSQPAIQKKFGVDGVPSKSKRIILLAELAASQLEEELYEEYYAQEGERIRAETKARAATRRNNPQRGGGMAGID